MTMEISQTLRNAESYKIKQFLPSSENRFTFETFTFGKGKRRVVVSSRPVAEYNAFCVMAGSPPLRIILILSFVKAINLFGSYFVREEQRFLASNLILEAFPDAILMTVQRQA